MVKQKEESLSHISSKCIETETAVVPHSSISREIPAKIAPSLLDEGDGSSVEDAWEVVLSLQCKKCSFLCHDKAVLIEHVKTTHRQNKSENVRKLSDTIEINNDRPDNNHSLSSEKLPTKDIPMSNEITQCDKTAPSLPQNEGEDMFLCSECEIVFPSEELCCKHMTQVHNLKLFNTQFIREEILSKNSDIALQTNRRKVKPPKQFTEEGGTVVPKKYRVTRDTYHSCSSCSVKFESIEVTKFHEQCHIKPAHGSEKKFSCPVCVSQNSSKSTEVEVFPIWGKLSMHLWREHKIDCELHTCSICKQFKSNLITKVKVHEQLHSSQSNYKCATCHKTFKQSKQLRTHEKYHKEVKTKLPPPEDARWYTPKECPVCKRILADSKCLKKHISAVHNKLKPYVCNICGHTSARKAELQLHVRQHTGEKPYKCPLCPFTTGDHNSLRNHKLRHGDERPYVCSYCDYRCIQSCAYKRHMVTAHPGQEVVFLCQLCNHASVNEVLFLAHQKYHEEGQLSTDNDTNSNPFSSNIPTASNSNSEEDLPKSTKKILKDKDKPRRYWLEEEDSCEVVVDTGGITIPAPEVETSMSERSSSSTKYSDISSKACLDVNTTTGTALSTKDSSAFKLPCYQPSLCLVSDSTPTKIFDEDESAMSY